MSQALREHFPQGDPEQEGPEWLEVRAGRSDGDEGLHRRCGLCSGGPLPREGAAGSKWAQEQPGEDEAAKGYCLGV